MYLHVTRYDYYYLQHMQTFLKVALLKLYAHFKETLCCVPAEKYSDGLKKMLKLLPTLFNAHFTSPECWLSNWELVSFNYV